MMLDEDLERELTKLEKYLIKEGRQDFVIEMRQGDSSTREVKLLNLAKHKQAIIDTMSKDQELKDINKKRSELRAPYLEQKRMNDKFSRFVHLLTEDSGDE